MYVCVEWGRKTLPTQLSPGNTGLLHPKFKQFKPIYCQLAKWQD